MRLYVVSRNEAKIRELDYLARLYGVILQSLGIPKIEVQSDRLEEVALHSATIAYLVSRKPIIVEDSGLYIKSLNMFPGALSSYVYRTIGIPGILKLMEGLEDREAIFESVIALAAPGLDGVKIFRGVARGYVSRSPKGSGGFGFDPIFIPSGYGKTFAEMSLEEKSAVSHRGEAFRALTQWLNDNCGRLRCWEWD